MTIRYLLPLLLLLPFWSNAQRVARGTLVDDKTGQPVGGCRVTIGHTRQFVRSDSLGRFEIELDSTQNYLEISDPRKRFGFRPIYLKQQTDLKEIRLQRYLTIVDPSMEIYRPNFFNKRHPTPPTALDDPLSLLQGRFPGLLVARPGSDPNETYTLRFHGLTGQSGNNAPAIWLDGVPVSDLSMVNPADIASIEVLPNLASAAAYGWGSAAGVILVNTQSTDFDAWHVTYEGGFAAAKATRVPEVGTATEFRQQALGYDFLRTTRWVEQVQQQGNSHTHHLAVTGGKQWLAVRAGLSFADRQGILQNSQYQQYQGNVTLTSYLPKQRLNLRAAWLGSSRTSNYSFPDAFRYALNANPTMPVRNVDDPNFNAFDGYGQSLQFEHYNPVALLEQNRDLGIRTGQTATLGASWRAKHRWSVTTHWSYQINELERGAFYDEQSLWRTSISQVPGSGRIDLTSERQQRLFGNAIVQFSQYFKNKSRLTLRGGGYVQDVRFDGQWRSGQRISKRVSEIGSLADIQTTNSEDLAIDAGFYDSLSNRYQLLGTLSEVSWRSAASTWVLTAGIRSEQGASSQVRTHNAPYQLVQYNLNKWLKIKELNYFHLLASNGQAANENVQGKWSIRRERTAGVQLETQNRRWFFGVQRFSNKGVAYGLFSQSSFPFEPLHDQEKTQVKNQGWEWSTRWKVMESRHFAWNVCANLSTLRSQLQPASTQYFTSPGAPGNGTIFYHKSYPSAGWGELWGFEEASVDADGTVRFVDVDGSGFEPDLGDYQQSGSGAPRRWWGLQNVLVWKHLRLDINLRGVDDHALAHENRAFYEAQGQSRNWLVTRYSSPLRRRQTPFYNRFVEDATFWRLDDLRLTWSVPLRQTGRLDCFVGGQNLWTSTQYTGNDPEVRIAGDRGAEDSGSQPAYSTPTDPRAIGIDRRGTYWLEKAFYTGVRLRLY